MELSQIIRFIQQHPELVEQLANSNDGQTLLSKMDSDRLNQATQQGQVGNYQQMLNLLRDVMNRPDGKALLERLAKQVNL